MANSLTSNPIYIDDFSAEIDLSSQYPSGLLLNSVEWCNPKGTSHEMYIQADGKSGVTIFHAKCSQAKLNIVKNFFGTWHPAPYIRIASGVTNSSGALLICRGN